MTKGNDKIEEGFYDRALDFLRDRLDAPCEAIPTPLLRYLCRETVRAPRITAASGEMPGPELFDYAIHRYMEKQRNCRLQVVEPEIFGYLKSLFRFRQESVANAARLYDGEGPTAVCYMQRREYEEKYEALGHYLEAVLRSRRFYRRTIRGMALFDFDRYPDLCTVLRYRIVNGEPFVRIRGKRYFNYRDLTETI